MADAPASVRAAVRIDDEALVTGEAVALDVRPASAVMRAGGAAIDVIATILIGIAAFFAIAGLDLDEAAIRAVGISLVVFCIVVLPTTVETASRGRSLGKLVMGLRVVRYDGGSVGLRHAFIRALVGVFELWLTIGAVAALVGAFTPRSQRLGDLVAGTYSERTRTPRLPPAPFDTPPPLVAWAETADVARLPERLARRLAQFGQSARNMEPSARARVAASLAAEASQHVSPVPAVDPETLIMGVVALRRQRELRALELERDRVAALTGTTPAAPRGFPAR